MPMLGEKGKTLGSQALAKGVERLAVFIDQKMNRAANKPIGRPSTYINVVGGLAGVLAPDYLRLTGTTKDVSEIAGGHMVNQVWDYLEEYMAPTGTAAVSQAAVAAQARYSAVETPGGAPEFYPPLYGQKTSPEPVLRNHVRYTLAA